MVLGGGEHVALARRGQGAYPGAVKFEAYLSVLALPAILAACSGGGSTVAGSTGGGTASAGTASTGTSSGETTTGTTSTGTTSSSSGAGGAGGTSGTGGSAACTQTTFGGSRPVTLHVPATYSCATAAPLVIMLHGYTATGDSEELYLDITAESDKRGFLYAHPDGTKDSLGQQFWNATDACCNLFGSTVDDSSYLDGLVHEIEGAYNVDRKRVYFVGHSNGGFMSYRMACDHAGDIAAIASLAGAMWEDTSMCTPSEPVSVLEIHGTADAVIGYNGGSNVGHTYPSAPTSVSDWVTFDACNATADTSEPPLDLDSSLPGNETTITKYGGCTAGATAELWTIMGGSHIPVLSATFTSDVIDFLYTQHKP
jgi:polyhydroxybutyrate depolymerase